MSRISLSSEGNCVASAPVTEKVAKAGNKCVARSRPCTLPPRLARRGVGIVAFLHGPSFDGLLVASPPTTYAGYNKVASLVAVPTDWLAGVTAASDAVAMVANRVVAQERLWKSGFSVGGSMFSISRRFSSRLMTEAA